MNPALSLLIAAVLLAGCSFAPEYRRPHQEFPERWDRPVPNTTPSELGSPVPEEACVCLSRQWWKRFQDRTLDGLVEKAMERNRDIAQGLARVESARAALVVARGALFPSLTLQGSSERSRPSLDSSETAGLTKELGAVGQRLDRLEGSPVRASSMPPRTGTLWSGTVQASWELDIWGRWRNAASAAREQLLSAEESQKALELSVAGQVCSAYFDLLNCDAQLELTEKTLAVRTASASLYERQYAAGSISELDILNVRAQVDSLKDSLAQVRIRREQAEAALLLLTGASPREVYAARLERGNSLDSMPSPPLLPAGIPSDLLNRRPDIVSAEAALRAAHFQVGTARAAFFPSISLTGNLGVESRQLGSLFSGSSQAWSFGGVVDWPLLTFGRTLGNVRQSEAAMREAAAAYEKTVQQAFRDVRNALALQSEMAESARDLERASRNMAMAAERSRLRYAEGYSPYLDVLEAERSLYSMQMQYADRKAAHLSAVAQVCVALGGGW